MVCVLLAGDFLQDSSFPSIPVAAICFFAFLESATDEPRAQSRRVLLQLTRNTALGPGDLLHDVVAAVLLAADSTATEVVKSIPELVVVVAAVVSLGIILLLHPAMDIAANSNFVPVAAAVENNNKFAVAGVVVGRVGGLVAAVAFAAAGVDCAEPRHPATGQQSRHYL